MHYVSPIRVVPVGLGLAVSSPTASVSVPVDVPAWYTIHIAYYFGAVAIDVHRMFHHDSTAQKLEHQAWAGPPLACHIYREYTTTCVQPR